MDIYCVYNDQSNLRSIIKSVTRVTSDSPLYRSCGHVGMRVRSTVCVCVCVCMCVYGGGGGGCSTPAVHAICMHVAFFAINTFFILALGLPDKCSREVRVYWGSGNASGQFKFPLLLYAVYLSMVLYTVTQEH